MNRRKFVRMTRLGTVEGAFTHTIFDACGDRVNQMPMILLESIKKG